MSADGGSNGALGAPVRPGLAAQQLACTRARACFACSVLVPRPGELMGSRQAHGRASRATVRVHRKQALCCLPSAVSHQRGYPIHRRPCRTAAAWAAARPCDYLIGKASRDQQGATLTQALPPPC